MQALENPVLCGLPDVCAEGFGLAIRLRSTATVEDVVATRDEVTATLRRIEDTARANGIDSRATEHAKFALVALIDEIVMSSPWPIQGAWAREPMQLTLFRTANAGEEFFD